MTTEGDGNYRLQRFLEQEGAEVDIQPITAWILYNIWEHQYDTRRRLPLRGEDGGNFGLKGKDGSKKLAFLWGAEKAVRAIFGLYARAIGLGNYHLADMDSVATISHQYYDNHLRGGEGHMEVGKLIQTVQHRKAHMVISVKPFGCMPSSGVSDGVQSLITARYPKRSSPRSRPPATARSTCRAASDGSVQGAQARSGIRDRRGKGRLTPAALESGPSQGKALHHRRT